MNRNLCQGATSPLQMALLHQEVGRHVDEVKAAVKSYPPIENLAYLICGLPQKRSTDCQLFIY